MIVQLDTENADRDIKTAAITVLTHTPDASNPMICQGLILLGDGAKNLDGTGGSFLLYITVGGQTIQPSPQTVTFSTAVRAAVWSTPFPVPANAEVIMQVKSPNAADSDVDVTAYLYDISAQGAIVKNNLDHLAKTATAAADMTTEVADNTVFSRILAAGDTSAFDPTTDGLQLIRDKLPTNLEDMSITDTTGIVKANVVQISDDATAADNLELACDGTGYVFANCTIPTVTTLTDNAGNNGMIAKSVWDALLAGYGATNTMFGYAFKASNSITGAVLADTSSDAVLADALWNAATATYGSAGSFGLQLKTNLDVASSTLATAANLLALYNTRVLASGTVTSFGAPKTVNLPSIAGMASNQFVGNMILFKTAAGQYETRRIVSCVITPP